MKGIFITGNDTNVGKTYIACQIASELHSRGINVIPRKPVESGCSLKNGKLFPSDAYNLQQAAQSAEPISKICPFQFKEAISPAKAARLNNIQIPISQLANVCLHNIDENSFLLVEGAGGFYSPICENNLNADLARRLELPVLLIVEDKIGSINQALLNLEAIKKHELFTTAIVLNQRDKPDNTLENAEELTKYTSTPIFTHNSINIIVEHLTKY